MQNKDYSIAMFFVIFVLGFSFSVSMAIREYAAYAEAESVSVQVTSTSFVPVPTQALIATPVPAGTLSYSGEMQALIEKFKAVYGIEVYSIAFLGEERVPNLPWSYDELNVVYGALEKLPPKFLNSNKSPTKIFLIKPQGTGGGPGGGYSQGQRVLLMYLPADYVLEAPSGDLVGQIFGTRAREIEGVVMHEYAHSYMAANPRLYRKFALASGWVMENGEWVYKGEPHKFHVVAKNPNEDFANSVSMAGNNPNYLTEDVLRFLIEFYPINNWKVFVDWVAVNRPELVIAK